MTSGNLIWYQNKGRESKHCLNLTQTVVVFYSSRDFFVF
jgi:hypothetical protein